MNMYIESGQFDELVFNILTAEYERREEEAEKEKERMIWEAYLHSNTDLSYGKYREKVMQKEKAQPESTTGKRDEDMTDKDVYALFKRLFPNHVKPEAPT